MMMKGFAMVLAATMLVGTVQAKEGYDAASAPFVAAEYATMYAMEEAMGTNQFDIEVTLTWRADADLDLRIADPTKCEVAYDNLLTTSGGMLEEDMVPNCGEGGTKTERTTWKLGGAIPGIYNIRARYFSDNCGDGHVDATIEVKMGGVLVKKLPITLNRAGDEETTFVHAFRVNTIYGTMSDDRGECLEETGAYGDTDY